MVTSLIFSIAILAGVIYAYLKAKNCEPVSEETVVTTHSVRKSKFMPHIFVGKDIILDSTLKYIAIAELFQFPTSTLQVIGIDELNIDGNVLELIKLKSNTNQRYILLIDPIENELYIMQNIMSEQTDGHTAIIGDDIVELTENGHRYEYTDLTGLIASTLNVEPVQVRMYGRTTDNELTEKLLLILNQDLVLDYKLGFSITESQIV